MQIQVKKGGSGYLAMNYKVTDGKAVTIDSPNGIRTRKTIETKFKDGSMACYIRHGAYCR